MKKLVLVFTMVVLLAAAVFGGQAIASNKPADVTVSEEASQEILFDWGSSYRGYPVRMKTVSGNLTIKVLASGSIEENYPGVRHVSLTVLALGLDHFEDRVYLQVAFTDNFAPNLDIFSQNGFRTYEFDTDRWEISATNWGGADMDIWYNATITYPSNQW
jgi:hypothetical protein